MEAVKKLHSGNGHTDNDTESVPLNASHFQSMLENSPINVMCADLDGTITYMNPKSRETLSKLEKHLPIPVDSIVGSSFDVFHKNPAHQRTMIQNERNFPLQTIIEVGGEKLDLLVTALRDETGKYIGPQVTWDIVTEKIKTQNEAARMRSMIENSPLNIMCCDLDGVITYMNPKSKETLMKLEKHLPIKVKDIVGSSFDVFHKNPAHQQQFIKNEKNLPHTAKIGIADESLDLLVTAMRDAEGNYIGPQVTWDIITEKVGLINTLTDTAGQLSSASEELSATASQMMQNAENTSNQSSSAASSAEEVSAGVSTVATNTEEMSASIVEISKASSEASNISKEAMSQAQSTNQTIKDLGEASQQIGNVIKVISSIAQQTNLLALNATIEAARAGDAGKGFAVVANEVKELAKQTAKATEDITKRIGAIQDSSGEAVTAIGRITDIIEKLNGIAMSTATAVEEQSATTNEVARVVQESNTGVTNIAHVIRQVAESANENKVGASQTLDASKDLSELANKLKELVDRIKV